MTGKRIGKVLLVWLCIITLLMPFASDVLAVTTLTKEQTTTTAVKPLTKDQNTAVLESMPYREGGKESTNIDSEDYDENMYSYSISDVDVLKVVQAGDFEFQDTFYCVNAKKSLTITSSGHNYVRATEDFTDFNDEKVTKWAEEVGISEDNFKSLVYLLNNLYSKNLNTNYKDQFIREAFKETLEDGEELDPPTTVDMIKTYLTDDDIEVIQQWAIWYFTNGSQNETDYSETTYDSLGNIEVGELNVPGVSEAPKEKQDLSTINSTRNTYAQTLYTYLVESAKKAAKEEIENLNPNNRNISLWVGEGDQENTLQPLVLLTEEKYDLALRKFIVSVNGIATTGREPVPTDESLEQLAKGSETTASYRHAKSPVTVKQGDRIVYEFRIYNEGNFDAKVKEIVDYLPEGLTVVDPSKSSINSSFNWEINDRTLINRYLENTTIDAFNKDTRELSYEKVQLECEITGDLTEGTVLTNVAEIKLDDGSDRDSVENSISPDTIKDDFSGNVKNKEDLTDPNYHYKGLQDDDDFEKVVIAGKQFDLSLQKFISKINNEKQNREPEVDSTPLKNGKDDANYTVSKNPVLVETGDVVTFTLRVYNEGEIDGYTEEITDYIPEGLGFLVNYNDNYNNRWKISNDSKSIKLSEVKNGTNNLKLSDFTDIDDLDNVDVVLGKSKITSTALASSATSTSNLIKAFDGTTLSYRDVQVSFIVVTEDELTLKNIAAITKEADKDRKPVDTDRGPGKDSTPADDINPDDYTTGNEDDDDYDVVKTDKRDFDLALQKFITGLNDEKVTDREPVVSKVDGGIKYTHPKSNPLNVGNGDLIEYTIRVYNEGEVDGFASEIKDDIPVGLVFVPDNETNKAYGWKMYDKSGNETTDVNQAVTVKTTYLSKESSEDNLIGSYDGSTLLYKDVKLVFKVNETAIDRTVTSEKRTLINTAEITKNTDKNGNDVPDIDSTPDNNKDGEDDLDREQVYVKYFDLALEKTLSKAIVTTNGEKKEVVGENLKIEIHRKNINSTSIQFVYNVKVTNQGEIEGYATEITDYVPEGLSFNQESNPDWVKVSDRVIKTEAFAKTLLQPGESIEVEVVLDWVRSSENVGRFVNVAEISEDWNPYDSHDVDSTPNNNDITEDDEDDAPVWVGVATGLGDRPYILLTSVVLVILGTGIILIKKYVL